jgi:Niemann-Pick C1 protein
MILVDLLAIMSLWGINLNALSLVNLVMAMGISVEFVAHFARAFIIGSGPGKDRTFDALSELAGSVFSGITLTKFIGICVLAFAHSTLFRIYYFRMFFAVVIVGALHGLAFFPAVLSYLGDFYYHREFIDVPIIDVDYLSETGSFDNGILDE